MLMIEVRLCALAEHWPAGILREARAPPVRRVSKGKTATFNETTAQGSAVWGSRVSRLGCLASCPHGSQCYASKGHSLCVPALALEKAHQRCHHKHHIGSCLVYLEEIAVLFRSE